MKKRMITGLITASVILALGGCGSASNGETTAGTASESVTETVEASVLETQSDTAMETAESETSVETSSEAEDAAGAESIKAYKNALENIVQNGLLPDGSELGTSDGYDLSENKFAVYDVDHDGRDELIFCYTTTSMAAMTAKIYDYDEAAGQMHEELSTFPMLTFYDNTAIGAGVSHNQGYAGDFWPYTFYKYDTESDTYKAEYFVDAWDKSLSDVNYNGEAFPDDADKDGDGIVYYLDSSDGSEQGEPMDKDAYDAWFSENAGSEASISFQNLTEENINNIQ